MQAPAQTKRADRGAGLENSCGAIPPACFINSKVNLKGLAFLLPWGRWLRGTNRPTRKT